ncbi:MAG: hypothetical protein KAX72_07445 [Chitinophagales bacterium]|nr:hypothetical protein [Chitinophagales bacterium]
MKTLKLVIFCFVLSSTCYSVFGGNSTGETITFTVDANGYTGLLQLNSGGEPQFGGTEDITFAFPLKDAYSCTLNTGASFEDVINGRTSDISIYFNKDHKIDSVLPKSAATIILSNTGIVLNTSQITINPKKYKNSWYTTAEYVNSSEKKFYTGKNTITLVNGLTYQIGGGNEAFLTRDIISNDSVTNYTNMFNFAVQENGTVLVFDHFKVNAKSKRNKLIFKTSKVKIDPYEISGGKELSYMSGADTIIINKPTKLWVIRSTAGFVTWQLASGEKGYYYFLPL